MSNEADRIRDDVAFLRDLAEGSISGQARDGAVLTAIGGIFALVALQYWAVDANLFAIPQDWRAWLWLDGVAPFLIVLALIETRMKRGRGPGSRAIAAAWAGFGLALSAAVIGLLAAAWRLGQPLLAAQLFPIILFSLLGACWGVAFAVRREVGFGLAAVGAGFAAILSGALAGRPIEWLALAAGLALLVGAPGLLVLRGSRAA